MYFWEVFFELFFKFREVLIFKNVCFKCDYIDFWGKKNLYEIFFVNDTGRIG